MCFRFWIFVWGYLIVFVLGIFGMFWGVFKSFYVGFLICFWMFKGVFGGIWWFLGEGVWYFWVSGMIFSFWIVLGCLIDLGGVFDLYLGIWKYVWVFDGIVWMFGMYLGYLVVFMLECLGLLEKYMMYYF